MNAIHRRHKARQDLVEIFRYYAREAGLRVAQRFFAQVEATLTRLAGMPGMGTHYTDNSHLGIHEASDIPIFTLSHLYSFASLHAAGLARSGRPVYVHWNGLANTRLK